MNIFFVQKHFEEILANLIRTLTESAKVFQNQAHIQNPHGTGQVFETDWGAAGAPIFFIATAPAHARYRNEAPGGSGDPPPKKIQQNGLFFSKQFFHKN